jgi:dTDP-4-dehydrorhamnose reductase
MNRVILFGSSGFLGSYLAKSKLNNIELYQVERIKNSKFFMVRDKNNNSSKIMFDCNEKSISEILTAIKPQIIFNTAAIASIEQCASNPDAAYLANSFLPGWISKYSAMHECKLIHFSTDAVFGQNGKLFKESEEPIPLSIYGKSKLRGELAISSSDPKALIIRTNFFGWSLKKVSLFNFFYNALDQNQEIEGFTNSFFTPIYVEELIEITLKLLDHNFAGLIHVTGSDRISKFEFGQQIALRLNKDSNLIKPSLMQNTSLEASRNYDLSLDNTKVRSILGEIPEFTTGIVKILDQIKGASQ